MEPVVELDRFGPAEAWTLGSIARGLAEERGLTVAVDIRRPSGQVLFRTALDGATADQDDWIRRKAAVVFRFEVASATIAHDLADADVAALGWLDPFDFALAPGSIPVRVRGAGVVAALTVSGAASEDDHSLAVDAVARFVETR